MIFGEKIGNIGNGTTNFFRSISDYPISIAWEIEPSKVVYNPKQQKLFWASKSHRAFLKIGVDDIDDVSLMFCVPPHRLNEL